MKRRAVRLAVGLWCLAIVYGATSLQEQWGASDAWQGDPEITSVEKVSQPADNLEDTFVFAKDFLLQGSAAHTLRELLFGVSRDLPHGREKHPR
jgi:hypothetical protein